jgi:hypothetical protein
MSNPDVKLPGRRRRALIGALLASAVGGCGRSDRIEATANWMGADHSFDSGIALFDAASLSATIGFFQGAAPAASVTEMKRQRSVLLGMAGLVQPYVVLDLRFREAGRAGYANLMRYSVLFANMGGPPMTFNRQHADWLQDGGIELAGEAVHGGRLLGRLRRAEPATAAGVQRAYRWDLGFDATLDG